MIQPDEDLGYIQILGRLFNVHRRHGEPKTRHQFVLTTERGHQYLVSDYGPRVKLHVVSIGRAVARRIAGLRRDHFARFGVEA